MRKPVKETEKEQPERREEGQENTLFWKTSEENISRRRQLSLSNAADRLKKMKIENGPLI